MTYELFHMLKKHCPQKDKKMSVSETKQQNLQFLRLGLSHLTRQFNVGDVPLWDCNTKFE